MVGQLQTIDLVAPGFRGLNLEQRKSILPPIWATVASNCIIDENGLLASRKGFSDATTTAVTGAIPIETLFEYVGEDEDRQILVAWDDAGGAGIANDIDDPEANIVDGSVVVTSGTWWFQNGWDKVFGFEDGQKPIVYSGTGTFATVSETSGTAPTIADGVGCVAFGRVWGLDADKQIIKFSALQDSAHWSTGAGQIDMASIWTNGTDHVTAITAIGSALVVFGHHHIVFWVDGQGSSIGINPDNLYVSDIIEGVGCESQWSVQIIGEADVWFVGRNGLQSLQRVTQSGAGTGVSSLSYKVQSAFLQDLNGVASKDSIRSVVDPVRGIYVVTFPSEGRSWVFHYTRPYKDEITGEIRYPITQWDLAPTAWLWDVGNQRLLLSEAALPGQVGVYGLADDDAGTKFTLAFEGTWMDLGEQFANRIKILKRIGSIIFTTSAATVVYKWDFDFRGEFISKTKSFIGGAGTEWGVGEWGLGEWSGGLSLKIFKFPAAGSGQYIKLGLTIEVSSPFAIQQLELFAKLGNIA